MNDSCFNISVKQRGKGNCFGLLKEEVAVV